MPSHKPSSTSDSCCYSSPLGELHLEADKNGLLKISLRSNLFCDTKSTNRHLIQTQKTLDRFFKSQKFQLPDLNWQLCTNFQKRVLQQLMLVKPGQTLSYSQLAHRSGSPKAARAVGSCMRFNPWPLLVPCHRIIPTSGGLGNYSLGGPSIKASLLEMEKHNLNLAELI